MHTILQSILLDHTLDLREIFGLSLRIDQDKMQVSREMAERRDEQMLLLLLMQDPQRQEIGSIGDDRI